VEGKWDDERRRKAGEGKEDLIGNQGSLGGKIPMLGEEGRLWAKQISLFRLSLRSSLAESLGEVFL
jgi:hypothetical protein